MIGLGLSIASAFPSALSYVGSHMTMTGKVTGGVFASANISVMVAPWVTGQFIETIGTATIPLTALLLLLIAAAVFTSITRALAKQQLAST